MIKSVKSDIRSLSIILKYCERIPCIIDRLGGYENFIDDWLYQMAISKNVEVIADEIKKLSDELKLQYQDIPWNAIQGMRNRMTHNYEGTNFEILWDAVNIHIPKLYERCISIMKELDPDASIEHASWLNYGAPKGISDESDD